MTEMPDLTLRETADRLGLRHAGRDWRGDCPGCGYRDAFTLSERDGKILGWCASCQDRAAVTAILRSVGALPPSANDAPLPTRASDAERRADSIERARQRWNGAEPITRGGAAFRYLEHRGIAEIAGSNALRWRPDTPHPGGGRRLALLARVDDVAGKFCGVQRIFLTPAGRKADVDPVKATLGAIAGNAVHIAPAAAEMVIGEGIETSASAGLLLGLPAWAAISAGNLAKTMMLPEETRTVTIVADHDQRGILASEAAWRRWRDEGRTVRIVKPRIPGSDFNDLVSRAEAV